MTEFLTVEEVAAKLGITPRRVRAMIAAEQLAAVKLADRWIVRPAALAAVRHRKAGRPPEGKKSRKKT
jgi:excisionase family DNA binding protein